MVELVYYIDQVSRIYARMVVTRMMYHFWNSSVCQHVHKSVRISRSKATVAVEIAAFPFPTLVVVTDLESFTKRLDYVWFENGFHLLIRYIGL